MTTPISKRAISSPRDAANRKSIEELKFAVDELSGTTGPDTRPQRAVRLCELLDAGLLKLQTDGTAGGAPTTKYVKLTGDIMTGPLTTTYLTVSATGGLSEGGEMALAGAPTYSAAITDNYQQTTRWFGGASGPMTWNRETGTLNVPGEINAFRGQGYATLSYGTATEPGTVSWRTADGVRRGYLGWNNTSNIVYQAENGWSLLISSRVGVQRLPDAGTRNLAVNGGIVSTGGNGALWTADRTSGVEWALYVNNGFARLYNDTTGDVVNWDVAGNFASTFDNARSCGRAGSRWSVVYAGTGTINTSDADDKTPVRVLSENELAAAKVLAREIGVYQWLAMVAEKGEANARLHVGMTVQRAIAVMESFGLNAMRYGFICYDEWAGQEEITEEVPAIEAEYDEETGMVRVPAQDGYTRVLQEARSAGKCYSFRTDQLLLFVAAGFEARLAALEAPDGPAE